ncbi:hypothetical protein SODALDRAFT_454 [Sodiomyces alkalinus F11]|uniref:Uncharacterized protein n=1 Tax=Sodiomyces alkalinus (strain CBS 110278 / VKM F-3762 / F11) TaxID=1314773 RepID=A0A3N2Q4W0_SODAK|nr:hypothetical protein SODALDRAFT_454 [Sodiomyces alkalinus F11]ROT41801.1 hypothetical protein SODALDRAFT_454 [Sodiomyces alkalinus F11]
MERSYLLSTLEAQGQKSTDAMRRLSSIQEQLGRNPPSPQRRKIKKQACLLKSKIAEMAEQERVILGRLAELHVELQNRERWARVQREMQSPCFAVESPITPSCWVGSDSTPSDLILTPTMPTPLDATSPEFIPGSRSCALAAYRPWSQPPYLEDGIFLSPDTESAAEFHSFGSPEGLQMWSNKRQLGNDQLRFEYDGNTYHGSCFADDHGPSNPRKHLSTYPSRERRMSLPSLRCIWPGLEEPGAVEGTHEAEKTY